MGYFRFEKLEVWKRSIEWADEVFSIADGLQQKYQFSLGEQLRRAALGVPTNIAEGTGRSLGKESAELRFEASELAAMLTTLAK